MRLEPAALLLAVLAACGGSVDAQPTETVVQPTEPHLGAVCTCEGASCTVAACGDGKFCKVSVYANDGRGVCTRACGQRGQRGAAQPSCPSEFQCTFSMDNDQQSSVDYCFSLR